MKTPTVENPEDFMYSFTTDLGIRHYVYGTEEDALTRLYLLRSLRNSNLKLTPSYYGDLYKDYDKEIKSIETALCLS